MGLENAWLLCFKWPTIIHLVETSLWRWVIPSIHPSIINAKWSPFDLVDPDPNRTDDGESYREWNKSKDQRLSSCLLPVYFPQFLSLMLCIWRRAPSSSSTWFFSLPFTWNGRKAASKNPKSHAPKPLSAKRSMSEINKRKKEEESQSWQKLDTQLFSSRHW